jgi:hypothetical protein
MLGFWQQDEEFATFHWIRMARTLLHVDIAHTRNLKGARKLEAMGITGVAVDNIKSE